MTKVMINKNVFGVEELNARELRLYLLICSRQYLTMNLTKEDKKFVLGSSRNNVKNIPTYFDNLVEYGLVAYDEDTDGYVSILEKTELGKAKNFIAFDELPNVKSLRQLFVLSLDKWHVRYSKNCGKVQFINNPIINKEMFENLFGNEVREINRYWNRTCEQCDVEYTWTQQANTTILIKVVEKNEFEPKQNIENEVEVKEEVKETVVAYSIEDEYQYENEEVYLGATDDDFRNAYSEVEYINCDVDALEKLVSE